MSRCGWIRTRPAPSPVAKRSALETTMPVRNCVANTFCHETTAEAFRAVAAVQLSAGMVTVMVVP